MKTNFALGLTQHGITLWQRDGTGWLRVDAVALDVADMDTAMAALVDRARKLSADVLSTKLVIPDDQILMTTLLAPGPGRDAQEVQIRAALAGRTPFPPEELVFDWSGAGTQVAVAVVARETLLEAEDFAITHGLMPVNFVAASAPDGFRGEPFFGLTRVMRAKRVNPADVPRDGVVVRETGIARLPEPKIPVVAPAIQSPVVSVPAAVEMPIAALPAEQPGVTDPVPTTASVSPPQSDNDPHPEAPVSPAPTSSEMTAEASSAPTVKPLAAAADSVAPSSPDIKEPSAANAGPPPAETDIGFRTRRQPSSTSPLPTLLQTKAWQPDAKSSKSKSSKSKMSGSNKLGKKGLKALTRLGDGLRTRYTQTNTTIVSKIAALRATLTWRKKATTSSLAPKSLTAASALADAKALMAKTPARPLLPSSRFNRPEQHATAEKAVGSPAETLRKPLLDTLRKVQVAPRQIAASSTRSATNADEAQRMTVFGARGSNADRGAPPLPRKALLVTGGTLLVLVSAAIWALYFMSVDTDTTKAPAVSTAEIATPAPLADPAIAATDTTDQAAIEAALGQPDAAQTLARTEDTPEAGDGPALRPAPADAGRALPSIETGDAVAETLQTPPRDSDAGRVAEIRSNGIVAPQDQSGAIASPLPPAPFGADPLPPLRGSSEALALQSPAAVDAPTLPDAAVEAAAAEADTATAPPALSGEEWLTINVTEGSPPSVPPAKPERLSQPEAPSPQGAARDATAPTVQVAETSTPQTEAGLEIRVTAGAPAITPPRRAASDPAVPATSSVQVAVGTATTPSATLLEVPDTLSEADLTIRVTTGAPAAVPPNRVVAGPAPSSSAAIAEVTPPGDPAITGTGQGQGQVVLAALPLTDDAQTTETATTPTPPSPGGVALSALRPAARPSDLRSNGLRPIPDPAIPPEPSFPDATAQAVETSIMPKGRPEQFAQVVQRALSAATQRQNATTAPPRSAPPPISEAIQTASAAAVPMPSLPTATSVAREATVSRAINLRKVNLLGVMGTSNNRRALVRLSNGRVVTVRVGESLDDGQVTAIGDAELRYNQRGRDVVLRIAS